jgi:hypothetical protein
MSELTFHNQLRRRNSTQICVLLQSKGGIAPAAMKCNGMTESPKNIQLFGTNVGTHVLVTDPPLPGDATAPLYWVASYHDTNKVVYLKVRSPPLRPAPFPHTLP